MVDDIEMKRSAVAGAYDSVAWREKVKKMSRDQVIAIYLNLKKQNRI